MDDRAGVTRPFDDGSWETCEDRGYECCETLSPDEHRARYGY